MTEFPALFQCIAFALEKIVAPLTMLWFTYHWSHLPLGDEYPLEERKVASAGATAGFFIAFVILFIFFHLYHPPSTCTDKTVQSSLSNTQMSVTYFKALTTSAAPDFVGALLGLVVGIVTSFSEEIRKAVLAPTVAGGVKTIRRPKGWLFVVALATSLGVASLILYYTGTPYCTPHLVLMWVYLALLGGLRITSAFKDSL